MVFIKKELQVVGAEIGEELVIDGESRRVRLAGGADHLGIGGAVRLDIDLLELVAALCKVLARGDAPWAPCFDVKLKRSRHYRL